MTSEEHAFERAWVGAREHLAHNSEVHSVLMVNDVHIAPSILAADFARLGEEVQSLSAELTMLHVDVMDGHFVPNISIGPPVIASLRAGTDLYLDCHLMITDPLRYLETMKASGADGVTAHIEAVPNPSPVINEASSLGLDVGLVINPATPAEAIMPYLDQVEMVLVMSVQPGFGGQSFIETSLPKVESLRRAVDAEGLTTNVQIDGGIDTTNARRARDAGANVLVAGSSVFGAQDPLAALVELKSIVGM